MAFRERIGPDPSKRMYEEARKQRRRGEQETADRVNQLNGMLELMKKSDIQAERNAQFALRDFEAASQKVLNDNNAFRKALLNTTEQGLKWYKGHLEDLMKEGDVIHATYGSDLTKDKKAPTLSVKVPEVKPDLTTTDDDQTHLDAGPANNLTTPAPKDSEIPPTLSDTLQNTEQDIIAGGLVLTENSQQSNIDRARALDRLNNKWVKKGYNRAVALDRVNNLESELMQKMSADDRILTMVDPLDDSKTIQIAVKDITLEDDPAVWREALNMLKREALAEIGAQFGPGGLEKEFVVDKLLPIAREKVNKMDARWREQWKENYDSNVRASASNKIMVAAATNTGDLKKLLETQSALVQRTFKDDATGSANEKYLTWLTTTSQSVFYELAKQGINADEFEKALVNQEGEFAHVKGGVGKLSKVLDSNKWSASKIADIRSKAEIEWVQHEDKEQKKNGYMALDRLEEAYLANDLDAIKKNEAILSSRKMITGQPEIYQTYQNFKAKQVKGDIHAQKAFLEQLYDTQNGQILRRQALQVSGEAWTSWLTDKNEARKKNGLNELVVRDQFVGYTNGDDIKAKDKAILEQLKTNAQMLPFSKKAIQAGQTLNNAQTYFIRKRDERAVHLMSLPSTDTDGQTYTEETAMQQAQDEILNEITLNGQKQAGLVKGHKPDLENPEPGTTGRDGTFGYHTGDNVLANRRKSTHGVEQVIHNDIKELSKTDSSAVLNLARYFPEGVPEHLLKLNVRGEVPVFYRKLALLPEVAADGITAKTIYKSLALQSGQSVEISDEEFVEGDKLEELLLGVRDNGEVRSWGFHPNSLETDRNLEVATNQTSPKRIQGFIYSGTAPYQFLDNLFGKKPLTPKAQAKLNARRIGPLHQQMLEESNGNNAVADNRTCLELMSENRQISEQQSGGFGRKNSVAFPNRNSALGFYTAADSFKAATGKSFETGVTPWQDTPAAQGTEGTKHIPGIKIKLGNEQARWLAQNDPQGVRYGWRRRRTATGPRGEFEEYWVFYPPTSSNYHQLCRVGY